LLFLLVGAVALFIREDVFTFDRATGELTFQRRTIVSQKEEHYPLSDIEGVVLVTDNRDRESSTDYYVSLLMRGRVANGSRTDNRLKMTDGGGHRSQREKADVVASFLGLPVQDETLG
jgi:hypothetical protein